MNMHQARILIATPIFPEVVARLRQHFEVTQVQPEDMPLTQERLIALLQHKDGVLLSAAQPINAQVLAQTPDLKIAANMAVGFNNFALDDMRKAGVVGTNTPDILTETTADFGFALLLATARRLTEGEHYLRSGKWKEWRHDTLLGADVYGSTLGIIGMGRIGQAIARRAVHGFGMKLVYHNRSRLDAQTEDNLRARYASTKEEVLSEADHVMLVLPYSAAVHHIIGAQELALMKPTATLVNVARGGIVDDQALINALQAGQIAAAGLDVFENEPALNPGFLALKNVVLTPHIASASHKTRLAMANLAADNLIAFFEKGKALTPVT